MKITAQCGLTLDVEVTYEQLRDVKIDGIDPLTWQLKNKRIESTTHVLGQDRVILRLQLHAGETVEGGGELGKLAAGYPYHTIMHQTATKEFNVAPGQDITVNNQPVLTWNEEAQGLLFSAAITSPDGSLKHTMWRLNLRPDDQVKVQPKTDWRAELQESLKDPGFDDRVIE